MNLKTIRTYLAITLLAVLVGLLLAEVYVRVTGDYWALYQFRERSLEYEPSLFARNVFPRRTQNAQRDPDVHYRINEHGFRGESFPLEKPDGTVRVMIYGGSAVFDIFADRGGDWPHRVQRRLDDRIDRDVQVINAGVPGNASFDSFGRFWAEGYRFNPDYVLIYHAWNDLKTFLSDRPLLRQFDPSLRVKYIRLGDPRITYMNPVDRFLGQWSQLYLRLRLNYYQWKLNLGREGKKASLDPDRRREQRISKKAVRQFRFTLENFVEAARNAGATPVLMTQARLVEASNTEEERDKIRYDVMNVVHPTIVRAYERADGAIRAVSREKQVPLIDAASALTGQNNLYNDHVHVSNTGSRELARLTADRLETLIEERPPEGP